MTNYYFSIPTLELSLLLVTIYLLPRHQSYGTTYLWLSAMPLMSPLLNASWKPIYFGKSIAASSLFLFYYWEESDTLFFVSLFLLWAIICKFMYI